MDDSPNEVSKVDVEKECPCCGYRSWETANECDNYIYIKCAKCGFHTQLFESSSDAQTAYLRAQNTYYDECTIVTSPVTSYLEREVNRTRLGLIQKFLAPGATILEVGPGSGALSRALSQVGYTVVVVEQSPYLADNLRKAGHAQVHNCDFDELDVNGHSHDAIVSCHIIEHVTNVRSHLSMANRLVKEGGYLFIATPNAGSWEHQAAGSASPNYDSAHLHLFTRESLQKCLRQCGWSVISVSTPEYSPGWLRAGTGLLRRMKGPSTAPVAGSVAGAFNGKQRTFASFMTGFRILSWPLRRLQSALGMGNELFIIARKEQCDLNDDARDRSRIQK